MIRRAWPLLAVLIAARAWAAPKPAADVLPDDDARAVYSVGYRVGRNLVALDLSARELQHLQAGLRDSVLGRKAAVNVEAQDARVEALVQARAKAAAEKEKARGQAYGEGFAKQAGAKAAWGGSWIRHDKAGNGAAPGPDDSVKVHYRGTLIDGTEFDSSYKRNEPAVFPLKSVIPCWTHGVAFMKAGGKATLVCPSSTAYGDRGSPPAIRGGATLVFEIELLEVVKPKAGA
ncbi:MAG: FKBP-type peptidyl-prolyl cis-trans isomerase [Elusimicrobia bacterium]|nr:FKBP-type peptidyl-prolyl cis-trans isomerase [Elusimicrobiota bacterium]